MYEKLLLRKVLSVWNIFGMDPLRKNKMRTIRALTTIAAFIFLLTECLMKMFHDLNSLNLLTLVHDVITFTAFYQATTKAIAVTIYRTELEDVVTTILKNYWKMDRFSKKLQFELNSIYRLVKKIMVIAIVLYSLTGLAFCGRPLILSERQLPIRTYHGSDNHGSILQYRIIYALQIFSILMLGLPTFLFFDLLFAVIIIHVIIELKLIKERLSKLAVDETNEKDCKEIKLLVEHHNLVLTCANQTKEIFSLVLLNQFVTTELMICICLLNIISDGFPPNFEQTVVTVPLICMYLTSLFIYCILGTFLTSESHSVADAAYRCGWWRKNKAKLRKSLVLVIQRSHKIVKMSAGGFIDLDLESFTNIMKVLLNLFTVAQALLSKTKNNI